MGEVIECEADDKNVKTIVPDLSLDEDSKGSDLPPPREYEATEDDVELDEGLAKEHRSWRPECSVGRPRDRPSGAGVTSRRLAATS